MNYLRPLLLLTSFIPSMVSATILFSEDFESGLTIGAGENWVTNANGIIVSDPLEVDNALSFSGLDASGDIFSKTISSTTGVFGISFDYLGTCSTGNCGGFFFNSVTGWDGTTAPYRDTLIDDGTWHSYSFDVLASSLYITIEDWSGSGGVAGDAFFDNILITDGVAVPEPSILALMSAGLIGLIGFARRKA